MLGEAEGRRMEEEEEEELPVLFFIDHMYSSPCALVFFNVLANSLSFILVPLFHIILFVGARCASSDFSP
jgi:hypothetical protein